MSSKIAKRQLREMMAAAPVCMCALVLIVRELTRRMHWRAPSRARARARALSLSFSPLARSLSLSLALSLSRARALSLSHTHTHTHHGQLVPQADKGAGKGRETAAAKSKPAPKMSKVLLSLAALCGACSLGSLSPVHSAWRLLWIRASGSVRAYSLSLSLYL